MKNIKEKKKLILSVLGALAAIALIHMIYKSVFYVNTDNAQIGAHVAMLSSRVGGTIKSVLVDENQRVKQGEILAQIDTSDYSNASDAAKAELASMQARFRESEINYKRNLDLYQKQAITKASYDDAFARYKELGAKIKSSEAQLDQANLNVSYTKIVAPTDGTVARKSVEPGQYVPAGQPLFGFVETNERWVTANLKETELEHVKKGQRAYISVDAVSHKSFEGEVESISPSTGAVFSLLPPENATGNFTKIVQRVPVKIKLLNLQDDDVTKLQAGLSADISIRVR